MILLRKAGDRGHSKLDWLNSHHTFSFADYYDENWMGSGFLRVINEDFIQPGSGFDMHPHRNMEIITYVVRGALEHKDSMGNGSIIKPGEIQRMSAGSGVRHSEFNYSDTDELHLLQIWIVPENKGMKPGYEQKQIQKQSNQFILIGSNNPSVQAVTIHQNIDLYAGFLDKNSSLIYTLNNHQGWLQLIKGQIQLNEHLVRAGDGVLIQNEKQLTIQCKDEAELLFFEMH